MEFRTVQGDIAAESADTLVNAAGTSLRMGTGAAGFGFEEGARIVCKAVRDYEPTGLSDVRVIAYSDEESGILERVADEVTHD